MKIGSRLIRHDLDVSFSAIVMAPIRKPSLICPATRMSLIVTPVSLLWLGLSSIFGIDRHNFTKMSQNIKVRAPSSSPLNIVKSNKTGRRK